MSDTFSAHLLLTLMEIGAHDNTWGTVLNDNFEWLDDKLGEVTSIATTGGSVTLTQTEERANVIKISGTLISNSTINFSGRGGSWVIENNTTGNFTVTIKKTSQTGFTVRQGESVIAYYDGADMDDVGGSSVIGKQAIWVPAAAMTPRLTNGAAPGLVELTSNKVLLATLDFDPTTQEYAQFEIGMPTSWNEGTLTFVPRWSHSATSTNFGVVWTVQALARSDDDAIDAAFGTEQTSTDTGGTTNDLYIGPESSAITAAGSPASGDSLFFLVSRKTSAGADTLGVDARLHGVMVFYTIEAANEG